MVTAKTATTTSPSAITSTADKPGAIAQLVVEWAIEQGHLEDFATVLHRLGQMSTGVVGGAASVVGVLELPFVLLLAWRFGQNATHGIDRLRRGFERVDQGDLSVGLDCSSALPARSRPRRASARSSPPPTRPSRRRLCPGASCR
jgi:hypothetical protein